MCRMVQWGRNGDALVIGNRLGCADLLAPPLTGFSLRLALALLGIHHRALMHALAQPAGKTPRAPRDPLHRALELAPLDVGRTRRDDLVDLQRLDERHQLIELVDEFEVAAAKRRDDPDLDLERGGNR